MRAMARASRAAGMAKDRPHYFVTSAPLRAWFEAHHATAPEFFVGFYKKASGKPSIAWQDAVEQALCFGWIDGVLHRIDDERHSLRFTPRRKGSIWSAKNIATVERLTAAGLMQPAGLAAFALRDEARSREYSFEQADAATLSPADAKTFRANAAAWAHFEAQAPWYRRSATHWVVSAKQEATRARRLATLIEDSAAGVAIKHLRRDKPKR
jgi:uncharacterized protein YdeI (YjbR/CyaY-like superfamily)